MMSHWNQMIRVGLCAAILTTSGCWTGPRTRPAVNAPPQPGVAPQEFGPSPSAVPRSPVEPMEAPALDGPAFPQSSNDDDPSRQGFNRKRYNGKLETDRRPEYAGTQPQPVILEGPIAVESPETNPAAPPQIGYVELPPAP